jgi:N4-(beta-N-acetylglucosaminyl)-L-asparaginase
MCVQTTMATGAVGGLRHVKAAVRVASLVKDYTHHTILVGEQAAEFAIAMGVPYESLTTQASAALNRAWAQGMCQPNFRRNVFPSAATSCGPYHRVDPLNLPPRQLLTDASTATTASLAVNVGAGPLPPRPTRRCGAGWAGPGAHDTIAILAMDASGHIAAATSTNGNCAKVPGRVGDAAVPGAGAYAVTGIGACGATGDGDVMMRFLPCYQVRIAEPTMHTPCQRAHDRCVFATST